MEVKPGYKQTEAGIIPEDWHAKRLADIGRFSKGLGIKKDESLSGTIPCIRYGEIYTHHNYIIKKFNSFISSDVAKTSQKLNIGDILFAGSGETKEEIGKAVAFTQQVEAYAGGDIVILTPKSTNSTYLGYALNSSSVIRQKSSKGQGDAVVHINPHSLGEVVLPIPSQSEQSAIAMALSDMDALLESLNSLITKKRAIKQAAMQQLLSGKARLPNFNKAWLRTPLGEALTIKHGKSQKNVETKTGPYPILATSGQIGLASQPIFEKPSVLIGRKGTIDKPQYMDKPFWSVDTLFYSEMKNGNIAKFFFYKFQLIDWMSYNEASGVPSLNSKTIESIECIYPNPTEQAAITKTLDDMGSEISALETRYAKASRLKQAMMQELLTGRTRLI